MDIQLSKVISTDEYKETVTGEFTMDKILLGGDSYPVRKSEEFAVLLENQGEEVFSISFKTQVVLGIPCSRCLEEVLFPVAVDVHEEIDFQQVERADKDEYPFLVEKSLDLDTMIFDEIVPKLPAKVLCKEDCKGLCPVCGTNLNDKECGCNRTVADPRMAAIQDIFKNFKEV